MPEEYRAVFDLNPMSVIINAYREVVLIGGKPDLSHLALAAALSSAAFLVGYWIFRRLGRGFADAI